MTHKDAFWPPEQGQIWVATSEWVGGPRRATDIPIGTRLLIATEPIVYSPNDDSWALEVVWAGGQRRIVASPNDLTSLDWLVGA